MHQCRLGLKGGQLDASAVVRAGFRTWVSLRAGWAMSLTIRSPDPVRP